MEHDGTGSGGAAGGGQRARPRPRYIFQVDSSTGRAVIRILDTATEGVFREIPVEDFLEYAKRSKDMRSLFFGQAGAAHAVGAAKVAGE